MILNVMAANADLTVNAELRQKGREIERAWRRHDPKQGRIPSVIKDRLADFKKGLARYVAPIERHLSAKNGMPDAVITECIDRRGMRRQQALAHARRTLEGAQIGGSRDIFELRWLHRMGL